MNLDRVEKNKIVKNNNNARATNHSHLFNIFSSLAITKVRELKLSNTC